MTLQEPELETPRPDGPPPDQNQFGLQIGILFIATFSLLGMVFGALALFAGDDDSGSEEVAAGTGSHVELSEFAIEPAAVQIQAGGTVHVENTGSTPHNLAVRDSDLATPDIGPGESAELDVASLAAGDYELYCTISGHADAGMTGTLTVSGSAGEVASEATGASHDAHGGEDTDFAALDTAMTESIMEYPAETEGLGNQPLVPEILPDGTKRFDLTAEIIDWEVEPGKIVQAWAYNGQVPGPWIKVDLGDRVQVDVHNRLPMGTDVHWHGVHVPNGQDGVAPITQPLIEAGEDYTYEFVADEPALGMYHAHHHGQLQVPNGMLGVFQVGDMPLPTGQTVGDVTIPEDLTVTQELPMVLNDAGVLSFSLNGKGFPATAPLAGAQGDWVLIHYLNEGLQPHPMHMHGFPQLVIGRDGMPLDQPYWADTINVAPGERFSVLVQLTDVGTWVWHCHILNHAEREDGMFGMVTAVVVE